MKVALCSGLLFGAISLLHGLTAPAAADPRNRVKLSCDEDGCKVVTIMHGHDHRYHKKTKIRFQGDVCFYRPWSNITVCRY